MKLSEVINTLHRRTWNVLKYDNINMIYARFDESYSSVRVYIILNDCPGPDTVTRMAVRYSRLFDDLLDEYTFEVLGYENYFKPDLNTYVVWNESAGFIGDPSMWQSY